MSVFLLFYKKRNKTKEINFLFSLFIIGMFFSLTGMNVLEKLIKYDELNENERKKLRNVTSLNLRRKNLRELPESIGFLTNLKDLDLPENEFTKLPDSIGLLLKLQHLNLRSNTLTSLPESIGNLSNLKELNLSDFYSILSENNETLVLMKSNHNNTYNRLLSYNINHEIIKIILNSFNNLIYTKYYNLYKMYQI
jgi:Leucine-rich repeat (LRR) protein